MGILEERLFSYSIAAFEKHPSTKIAVASICTVSRSEAVLAWVFYSSFFTSPLIRLLCRDLRRLDVFYHPEKATAIRTTGRQQMSGIHATERANYIETRRIMKEDDVAEIKLF